MKLLLEAGAFTMPEMVDFMVSPGSFFLDEGDYLLIQEFGKKYGNYYSILSSIASGRNTMAEILSLFTCGSIGGQMNRLEDDYGVVSRKRPVLSKEGTQNVRYEISDNFLRFWFRYINRDREFIEAGNLRGLAELIKADHPTRIPGWYLKGISVKSCPNRLHSVISVHGGKLRRAGTPRRTRWMSFGKSCFSGTI